MGIPIRMGETIYNTAKKVAKAEFRSILKQIKFCVSVGKCALENPALPVKFIKELITSKRQDRTLAEPFNFA